VRREPEGPLLALVAGVLRLAQRNLLHDKVRLAVTLTGVVFAVVLMVVELGLFVGFNRATSTLIDHCRADLWIISRHVPYIEVGVPFNERKIYRVRVVPGVLHAEKFISRWTTWKHPDGQNESVQVVGYDLGSRLIGPWNLVAGSVDALKAPDSVIIDEIYQQKLGVRQLGQVVEIGGRRARVVGLTHGIRPFTTSPFVFTSFKRAQDYTKLAEDQTMFGLVELAPGADRETVRRSILASVRGVDVVTTREFSSMTRSYWMFTTGAGVSVLLAAVLGLIVGFVIVAQTIYATTMDHLREFGTLKAMGAPNSYVYKVIIAQAAMSALAGYFIAMLVSVGIVVGGSRGGAPIVVPPELAVLLFFITVSMCVSAALVSIRKVTRLDPAMVFKN
jgi:putative ABC transport system permease protein